MEASKLTCCLLEQGSDVVGVGKYPQGRSSAVERQHIADAAKQQHCQESIYHLSAQQIKLFLVERLLYNNKVLSQLIKANTQPHPQTWSSCAFMASATLLPSPGPPDPCEDAEPTEQCRRDALRQEATDAFKSQKKRRRHQQSDITWLSLQCSGGPGAGGGSELYPLYLGDRSKLTGLEKQSYRMWKSVMEFERVCHPIRQRRRAILIQPITHLHGNSNGIHGKGHSIHGNGIPLCGDNGGEEEEELFYKHTHIDGNVLELLQLFCSAYFSEMQVRLAPPLDLSEIPKLTSRIHKRTNRRQFLVDDIINFLSSRKLRKAYCILGVTTVDLYPGPEWNFVLGQACKEKGSGVFSFGRYFHSTVSREIGGRGKGEEGRGGEESGCGSSMQAKEIEEEQTRNMWILMRVSEL